MRRHPLQRLLLGALKALAVLAVLVWSLAPILLIVSSSLKPEGEIFAVPPSLFFTPTFAHYAALWGKWPDFFRALLNSAIITALATVIAVFASLLSGYAYSRFRSRWLAGSAFLLIVVRLIPPIVTTLPLFPVANALGVQDTHVLLAVLYATFFVSLGSFVMRAFIDQIPRELDEAAAVDGAGRFTTLWRVITPLAAQGMMAVAVFVVVYAWNEFLFAFIFTSTRAKTAPLVLAEVVGSFDGVEWGTLFAAATVQLLPVLAFVWITQKYLVAGLTAGATKG
ncbi:carbohydrate ABC transporter permease [Roseomonas haemaphysalidis]|uniref:Maltose/maltodextrin transport system permease protein MalG n=1 Tax=Roseomonas haemaphysalidis TaxID=2768162 RepID=A0ABS3KKT4_9PROT|nr:carbohydrate ABC transporter permease [Roseomonas haemaphysalidis]MBO1078064.1 carbohydrate ABC transporter permease [Roseomonas haemaphysalidis]